MAISGGDFGLEQASEGSPQSLPESGLAMAGKGGQDVLKNGTSYEYAVGVGASPTQAGAAGGSAGAEGRAFHAQRQKVTDLMTAANLLLAGVRLKGLRSPRSRGPLSAGSFIEEAMRACFHRACRTFRAPKDARKHECILRNTVAQIAPGDGSGGRTDTGGLARGAPAPPVPWMAIAAVLVSLLSCCRSASSSG